MPRRVTASAWCPGIAGERGDDRHERGEHRDAIDERFGAEHDECRGDQRDEADHEPRKAPLPLLGHARVDRFLRTRTDRSLHVLGLLFADDVDDVVHRDHAEQAIGGIDDGHHEGVVALHLAGERFLIEIDAHRADVVVRDITDGPAARREQHVAQAHEADEAMRVVHHRQVREILRQFRAANRLRRRRNRHFVAEGEELGRHQTARAVFLVADEDAQGVALFLRQRDEDRFAVLLVDRLQQVRRVVRRHELEQLAGVRRLVLVDEVFEHARRERTFHLRQRFRRRGGIHRDEQIRSIFFAQRLEGVRRVGSVLPVHRFGKHRNVDRIRNEFGDTLGIGIRLDVIGHHEGTERLLVRIEIVIEFIGGVDEPRRVTHAVIVAP